MSGTRAAGLIMVLAALTLGAPALAAPMVEGRAAMLPAMGSGNPYEDIQVGVSYTVYQPGNTRGLPQRQVTTVDCAAGTEASVSSTYSANRQQSQWYQGTYISLLQGNPICADGVTGRQIATARINGQRATVFIGCDGGTETPCPRAPRSRLAQVGGTLEVTFPGRGGRPSTDIRMGFGGLTLGQALQVARSLAPVD